MTKPLRILPARLAHSIMLMTGGFTIVLGLLVLLGWQTYHVYLHQVVPTFVPMQYNAALGLLLCSGGCLALVGGGGMLLAVLLTAVGHLAYTARARARQVASANQELQRIFPPDCGERRTISEGYLHSCSIM